jgi:RNA polymerase sigma factor (TIGR02999 family)
LPTSSAKDVTKLLAAWSQGDEEARDKLLPLVYHELRRVASRYLRNERRDHTLQATALVHETYLRLVEQKRTRWQSRAHFFGVAAQLMRRILVDHARRHATAKRGGALWRVGLDENTPAKAPRDVEMVVLDDALEELAGFDPKQARLVELRFFGGLTLQETAEVLGISVATVKREWSTARAWLHARVAEGGETA